MKLEALLKDVSEAVVSRGPLDVVVAGLAYDSRQVRPGYLFAAIPGSKHDGAAFVAEAVQRGALAVLAQRPVAAPRDVALILVPDARRALAEAAAAFYEWPARRLRVVGVTGTNGKTTVTFMLKAILGAAGWQPGLLGTVQYQIGARVLPAGRTTPEASDVQALLHQMVQAGCRSVAMEVSSHALAQGRVHGVEFDVAAFTNLTRDHLDFHQTMEQYFEAKARLFLTLGQGGKAATAVVNTDDPWGQRLVRSGLIKGSVITFGARSPADVHVVDEHLNSRGSTFRVRSPWGECAVSLNLLGHFNVLNALAALAAGGSLGLPLGEMAVALTEVRTVPGRLEEIPTGRDWRVFVDYAHTDDALRHALETLRTITRGRLLVVFGCGGNRDRTKRPLMGAVAAELADHAVLTSDNPRQEEPAAIIAEIKAGFGSRENFTVVEDRAAAIRTALEMARTGDVVLVAGKGHETTQEFTNTIIPFDDRQVIRNLLRGQTT